MNIEDYQNKQIYVEHLVRKPDFSMAYEHMHKYYEFYYLHSGNCVFSVNNTLYPLNAGDAFLVAPDDCHFTRYEGNVPCERTTVYFYPEQVSAELLQTLAELKAMLAKSGKIVLVKEKQTILASLLERMFIESSQSDAYSAPLLSTQLSELLLQLKRHGLFVYEKTKEKAPIGDDIEAVMEYINLNYHLPITLVEIAQKANLSPTYLSKKFRRITGVTFKEYLNYIRIRRASQALLTTDDSITQIAADCGFNGSNYLRTSSAKPPAFLRGNSASSQK